MPQFLALRSRSDLPQRFYPLLEYRLRRLIPPCAIASQVKIKLDVGNDVHSADFPKPLEYSGIIRFQQSYIGPALHFFEPQSFGDLCDGALDIEEEFAVDMISKVPDVILERNRSKLREAET